MKISAHTPRAFLAVSLSVCVLAVTMAFTQPTRLPPTQEWQPLPRGLIVAWYGPIAQIPAGWLLCDGSMGTPDLRDRFVVGAGAVYSVHDDNPAPAHTHGLDGVMLPAHTHSLATQIGTPVYRGNSHYLGVTTEHGGGPWGDQYEKNRYGVAAEQLITSSASGVPIGGQTGSATALPPFHALAYIMKR